jgi:hypothetical protein
MIPWRACLLFVVLFLAGCDQRSREGFNCSWSAGGLLSASCLADSSNFRTTTFHGITYDMDEDAAFKALCANRDKEIVRWTLFGAGPLKGGPKLLWLSKRPILCSDLKYFRQALIWRIHMRPGEPCSGDSLRTFSVDIRENK